MPATTPLTNLFVILFLGLPNLKEFIRATGRAPIVNTSRKIPPTPVAAP